MPVQATRHNALRTAAFELLLMIAGILFVRREIWQLHVLALSLSHWQEGLLLPLSAIDGGITGAFGWRLRHIEHLPSYRTLLRWGMPLFFVLYVACGALSERLNIGVFPILPELWRCLGVAMIAYGLAFRLWSQLSYPNALTTTGEPASAAPPVDTQPISERAADPPPAPGVTETLQPQAIAETNQAPTSSKEDQIPPQPPKRDVTASVENISPGGPAKEGSSAEGSLSASSMSGHSELFLVGPHKLLRYPDAAGRLMALCGIPLCFNAWLPLLAVPGILTLLKWHISDREAFRISQLGEPYLEYRKKTWNLIPYIY